jgi:hypothetical protein
MSSTNIKVILRVRPFTVGDSYNNNYNKLVEDSSNIKDILENNTGCFINKNTIKITDNVNTYESQFDKILDTNGTQEELYNLIKTDISSILKGINVTIFAYGHTGSGKTYSMFGSKWTNDSNIKSCNINKINSKQVSDVTNNKRYIVQPYSIENGIIPRSLEYIFSELLVFDKGNKLFKPNKEIKNSTVYCSYMQIYNEKILDLLSDKITNKVSFF